VNTAPLAQKAEICAQAVAVAEVDAIWPMIADDIVRCLEKTPSYLTAGDLWTMCRSGKAFLLAVHDGSVIRAASVWQFEGQNFVCLVLVGRGSSDWIPALFDAASFIAKAGGAKTLMATARIGLGPRLKKHLPTLRTIRHTYTVEV